MARGKKRNRRSRNTRNRTHISRRNPRLRFPEPVPYNSYTKTYTRKIYFDTPTRIITAHQTFKRGTTKVNRQIASLKAPRGYYKAKSNIFKATPKYQLVKALVCTKRKLRKKMMHATKKAGKGGQKPAKWTTFSKIKC